MAAFVSSCGDTSALACGSTVIASSGGISFELGDLDITPEIEEVEKRAGNKEAFLYAARHMVLEHHKLGLSVVVEASLLEKMSEDVTAL